MGNKRQHILTLVCLLILLIPNIACMALSTDLTYSWMKEVVYLAVVILCYALPMPFLKQRTYFILAGLVGLFWMPIEVSSLYLNNMTTSPHFIGIILETNWIEASEVIKTAWPLMILTLCLWVVYWWMVSRLKNDWILPKIWCKICWYALPTLFVVGLGTSYLLHPQRHNMNARDAMVESLDKTLMKFYKIYPYDIYLNAHQLYQEYQYLKQSEEQLKNFRFGIHQKQDSVEEHYIFIIGEAARYDHFHINGYERQTSPGLDTVASIYSLRQMYSEANLTRNAVQLLLTRADVLHRDIFTKEKSIIEAYTEAGYQTAWLSCQTMMDIEKRMASVVDFQYEQVGGLSAQVLYDDILNHKAKEILVDSPADKTFFLYHVMGSHLKYDQRYPKEYERFTPAVQASDGYAVLSAKNKEKVVNAYDNTILYTSHVIAEAIRLLQELDGIRALVYVSDHGENLFDDERELSVHGSYEGTIHEAHVPCFVWLSEEFKQAYPEKVEALEANLHTQVQSDVVFYSLADMGGLDKIVQPDKSIFSHELQRKDTIRMMTGNGEIRQLTINN